MLKENYLIYPKHPIMTKIIILKDKKVVTFGCIPTTKEIDKLEWIKLIVFFQGGNNSLCRRLQIQQIDYNSNDLL